MDARGMVNKLVALAAVFSLTFSPAIAMAGEIVDGSVPANGLPQAGDVGATWNGSAHKVLRSDASGILRTTEEYPYHLQNDAFPASDTTNTVIFRVIRPLGLGWSVSPFGARTVTVTKVQKGPPCAVKFYLFGSDDNVNYYPIIKSDAWSYLDTDSAKIDTLTLTIPASFQSQNSVRTFKLTLPEEVYPGRYLQIWAQRTDSAFASNATHVGLTYEGRWK